MSSSANFSFGLSEAFSAIDQSEIDAYILGQKAQNTVAKERTDLNQFVRFCLGIGEKRGIDKIPPMELDNILCKLICVQRTKRGNFTNRTQYPVFETRGNGYWRL